MKRLVWFTIFSLIDYKDATEPHKSSHLIQRDPSAKPLLCCFHKHTARQWHRAGHHQSQGPWWGGLPSGPSMWEPMNFLPPPNAQFCVISTSEHQLLNFSSYEFSSRIQVGSYFRPACLCFSPKALPYNPGGSSGSRMWWLKSEGTRKAESPHVTSWHQLGQVPGHRNPWDSKH